MDAAQQGDQIATLSQTLIVDAANITVADVEFAVHHGADMIKAITSPTTGPRKDMAMIIQVPPGVYGFGITIARNEFQKEFATLLRQKGLTNAADHMAENIEDVFYLEVGSNGIVVGDSSYWFDNEKQSMAYCDMGNIERKTKCLNLGSDGIYKVFVSYEKVKE